MKIATIAYLHGAGGAERQIIMLSNEMAIRGHEVHMIVLSDFKAPYPISEKVTVHDLSGKENGKLSVIKRFLAFRSTIKEIRPDITINYNIQGAYFSLLVGKSSCGKILYSERGDPYDKEYSVRLEISPVGMLTHWFSNQKGPEIFSIYRKSRKSL